MTSGELLALLNFQLRRGRWMPGHQGYPNERDYVVCLLFYWGIVRELFTTQLTLRCMGTTVILLTGAGYALSARARAIAWLLVPFLCGRAGRSALVTASVSLILRGPIESMMINSKVAVDSFMCLGALSYNHTKERLLLMYKPIKRIIWDFDVSGDDREAKALEADAEYVDKVSDNDPRSKLVREKYEELKKELESDGEIEADYAKKLELRCEGIFSQGVRACRNAFKSAEARCFEALSILGYLLCWPMKLTILCHVVSTFLGKRTCDGLQPINAGFGQSISAMEAVKREFDANFRVNVQYKLITPEDAINVISPEDLAKGVQAEFENRHRIIPLISIALSRLFAVVLLSAVLEAKEYVEKYLDDLAFDNIYVTEYFCKIDERRARKGLDTLLPLKRYEAIDIYDPLEFRFSRKETTIVMRGVASNLVHVAFGSIVLGLDYLIYDVLDIIRRNADVEFIQEGTYVPVRTSRWLTLQLYLVYGALIGLVFAQLFTTRMRRAVCAYFFAKREKKRVLHLYNKTLKHRAGYLRYVRHRIRKLVRDREFDLDVGWFEFVRKMAPRAYRLLQLLGVAHQRCCLVCGDPEDSASYVCPTEVCQCIYCFPCWSEIGRCYACEPSEDEESPLSDESPPFLR
ncbi:hypothetical protein HPB49_024180 [Dermacentor silvarum]|uniref:Uncharacterized protein n=1 Tax=Dermacentor silvarum TaxID=543639 RepID=A0ACB8CIF4_DERSI|nr:hypothetical protein HPB49_024180 [Dermacentor silvarum]